MLVVNEKFQLRGMVTFRDIEKAKAIHLLSKMIKVVYVSVRQWVRVLIPLSA